MIPTPFKYPTAILLALLAVDSVWGQSETSGKTSATAPTSAASQNSRTPGAVSEPSVEQRITVLEERLNTALALKDERITDINDRIDGVYKLAAFVAALASIL